MAAVAFAMHVLLFSVALAARHWSVNEFASLRDGGSYLHLAQVLAGQTPMSGLATFERRVFIGYPVLISILTYVGLSVAWAALLVNWIATAFAAPLAARLSEDARVGWAMAILTPSYLMYATLAMTEATLLCFTLWGLWRARQGNIWTSGMLLGFAGLIRPMACFAVLGLFAEGWNLKRGTQVFRIVIMAGAVVLVGTLVRQWGMGDAFGHLRTYASDQRAYGGHLFSLPFTSLIETPLQQHIPIWKVAYIWVYVMLTLVGCWLVVRERSPGSAVWLIGNTVFVISLGSVWGFQEFHRFILPALPPLLWSFRRWFPTSKQGWIGLGSVSWVIALVGLLRSG